MVKKAKYFDAIVLGSGVAGLGCAVGLALRGKKILVIGKKGVRGESTQAAAGILDPLLEMKPRHPLLKLNLKAFSDYAHFVRQLQKKTQMNVSYQRTGMLYVAETAQEERILRKRFIWQKRLGFPVRWMKREAALGFQSGLTPQVRAGLLYPSIARLNAKKLRLALIRYARQLGVKFAGVNASPLLMLSGEKIYGVRIMGAKFQTPIVINATGSWAGRHRLGRKLQHPILPVRGQILILKGRLPVHTILHSMDGFYLVPWDSGQYLLGSTLEWVGFKPHVTPGGIRSIRHRIEQLIPAARSLKQVESWAGLRPVSRDFFPLIGPSSIKGYYLALGYYRSGILLGYYAGCLLARAILTGKIPQDLKPFSPLRLGKVKIGKRH